MKKSLFTTIIILLLIIPLMAQAVSNPVVHLSFDDIGDGFVVNERNQSQQFTAVGVSGVSGYTGGGISVIGGGVFAPNAAIGNMLKDVAGMTFSAYVKNGSKDSGNLLTVYQAGTKAGIKIEKSGSSIIAKASAGLSDSLIISSYNTGRTFADWTHIAVGIDFERKMVRFYVDGVHLKTIPAAYAKDAYAFSVSSMEDKIGDTGLMLDEVKINPYNIHCSEPMTMYKLDSGYTPDEAYNDVLADSLVTHFSFDNINGNTVSSDGGFIEVEGIAQTELDSTEGVSGSAVVFHSDEKNWINIGSNVTRGLNGAKGLTISGWFYVNKLPGSGTINRVLSLNIVRYGALFHLIFRNTGEISASLRSGTEGSALGLNFVKTNNADEVKKFEFEKWHHITITTDLEEKYMRLFIDGEELMPNNSAGSNTVAYDNDKFVIEGDIPDAYIGGDPSDSKYSKTYNGAMDELKIYNRAVTANQARYIYRENTNGSVKSRDIDNYAALNKVSEDLIVIAEGCNEFIADGKRQRISWDNPEAVPEITGSTLFVPSLLFEGSSADAVTGSANIGNMQFVAGNNTYIADGREYKLSDAPYVKNGVVYVPFRKVAEGLGMSVSYDSCGLALAGTSYAVDTVSDGEYKLWLYDALTNLPYEKPSSDHFGTRGEIYVSENPAKIFPSSPAIVKLSDGTLVASHDTIGNGTTIYRSSDGGVTWQKVRKPNADSDDDNIDDTIEEIVYANLFTLPSADTGAENLYLMGVRRGTGDPAAVAIYRSTDGGLTWSVPTDNKTGWIVENDGTSAIMPAHTAPTPVVRKDGRIYRGFDVSGSSWQNFKVAVMSADEKSDLLDRRSWTISNTILLKDYISKIPSEINCPDPGMLEANAVIGPDGKVWIIARFNSAPSVDYAAVLKLESDTKLVFDRIIRFPGGMTKFNIRYDESTGKYIALANPNIHRDYPLQRICLSMLVSDDLYNWEIAETLLVPNWLENLETLIQKNSFQYPDFVFDGEDILYVVRESAPGAADYHNANCITFYRLKNYKQYISD